MVCGFLLALLGAILPAWGAHRDPTDFTVVGNYFLGFAVGLAVSAILARGLVARRGIPFLLVLGCWLSCAAMVGLSQAAPPATAWLRVAALAVMGVGTGLLSLGLFHAVSPSYHADAAGAVTRAGIWYGSGGLAVAVVAAISFYTYNVAGTLLLLAAVPALFATIYSRSTFLDEAPGHEVTLRRALRDFRSLGAILFALLLFFQFGNEWSIAGWLPLFLIRRTGLSPVAALLSLALYSLFLTAGRLGAVAVLPHVRHGRLLVGSVLSALFGCLILYFTRTGFGVASGLFFMGAGYASVYPLVAEAIGRRFPYYHPGFFNGIFSVAMLGGLLAPATLGYAASAWGVGVVVGIPLLGTCMVMVLILSIWLESKLTGR